METTKKLGPEDFIDPSSFHPFAKYSVLYDELMLWCNSKKPYRRFGKIDLYSRTFETTDILEEPLDPRTEHIYLLGTYGTIQITDPRLPEWIKLEKEQMKSENFQLKTTFNF